MSSPQAHVSLSRTTKLADEPTRSTLARLSRWVGPLCMATAVLIILHQVVFLFIVNSINSGSPAASVVLTLPNTLNSLLLIFNFVLLLLCLTGLYLRQAEQAGTLGLVAFLIAFLGTVLLAGDWWFEAFVIPFAPQLLDGAPGGTLLAGGVTGFALFALGWLLFGIASYRARVFLRSASLLLALGGAIGYLAGFPPYQVPLALAVGWIGYGLRRSDLSSSNR